MNKNIRAFTLIELSIVVVIIGLIVAGVVAGQSLVRQAKVRAIISESEQYRTAYNGFFLQYNAIPGDMINAHSYWGSSCHTTASNCNGNGNKLIGYSTTDADLNEIFMAWKHLSLAELVQGSFTGTASPVGYGEIGVNIPVSAINNGGFFYEHNVVSTFTPALHYGAQCTGENWVPKCAILTPQEAYNIDAKFDNGLRDSGLVRAFHGDYSTGTNCFSGSNYALTTTSVECYIYFLF